MALPECEFWLAMFDTRAIVETPREDITMCRLFASQDPQTYEPETRPIRLHGHATSVRLEAAFWEILEEIATDQDMSVARFIATLYDEVLAQRGEVPNLASLLRVSCLLYLRNRELHTVEADRKIQYVA